MNKLITFDLNKQKNYTELYKLLTELWASRLQDSAYYINSNYSNIDIINYLNVSIDIDDSIIVTNISNTLLKNTPINCEINTIELLNE